MTAPVKQYLEIGCYQKQGEEIASGVDHPIMAIGAHHNRLKELQGQSCLIAKFTPYIRIHHFAHQVIKTRFG